MWTIKEPPRQQREGTPFASDREILSWVRGNSPTFVALMAGFGFYSMVNFGTAAWLPSFLTRVHHWSPGKIGLLMGGATMTFGVFGIYAGGWLADRWLAKGRLDAKLLVGIVGSLGALASAVPLYLYRSDWVAIALLIPLNIFSAFPFGAAQAALQEVSPSAMRARITALYLFANTLIGFSLGPTAVAYLTDYVFRNELAVGYSILVVAAVGHLTASTLLNRGRRSYGGTVRAARVADSVSL
jgi:MFS family permease